MGIGLSAVLLVGAGLYAVHVWYQGGTWLSACPGLVRQDYSGLNNLGVPLTTGCMLDAVGGRGVVLTGVSAAALAEC